MYSQLASSQVSGILLPERVGELSSHAAKAKKNTANGTVKKRISLPISVIGISSFQSHFVILSFPAGVSRVTRRDGILVSISSQTQDTNKYALLKERETTIETCPAMSRRSE
jgi:hypothetical protein